MLDLWQFLFCYYKNLVELLSYWNMELGVNKIWIPRPWSLRLGFRMNYILFPLRCELCFCTYNTTLQDISFRKVKGKWSKAPWAQALFVLEITQTYVTSALSPQHQWLPKLLKTACRRYISPYSRQRILLLTMRAQIPSRTQVFLLNVFFPPVLMGDRYWPDSETLGWTSLFLINTWDI